ncbi:MAG: D-glycerate dehydrogenase [Acidobacteriota bacterium]
MSKFRIFATCDIGEAALDRLRSRGWEVEIWPEMDPPPYEVVLEKVRSGVDALITTLRDRIDEGIFAAGAGRLKVVAQDAVGHDNIDREAANRYRIPFTNTPDVLTHATAEFAFFILGAVARKLFPSEELVRAGKWRTWHPYLPFLGTEVTGKTVAVIGTGRIGRAFAGKCAGFDLDLLLYDTRPDPAFAEALQRLAEERRRLGLAERQCRVAYVDLRTALGEADFVSLHVPLTPETRHLLNEERLSWMKPTAYLINTSRGPVVDEQALADALLSGRLAGAALDVFGQEPLPLSSPLLAPELREKVRVFHHFASGTAETRLSPDPARGMAGRCVQALIDVLEGRYGGDPGKMPWVVNKEAFSGR